METWLNFEQLSAMFTLYAPKVLGALLTLVLGLWIIGMITNGLVLLGASAYIEPVAKGSIIVVAVLVDTLIRRRRA